MRFHKLLLLVSIVPASMSVAQDPPADPVKLLSTIKTQRNEAIREAATRLTDSIDKAISEASKRKDAALVKQLVAEQEVFNNTFALPSSPSLEKASIAYLETRRSQAKKLREVYLKAIEHLKSRSFSDEAEALQIELDSFVEQEKRILNSQSNAQKSREADTTEESSSKAELEEISKLVVAKYEEIDAEPTSAKKSEAVKKFVKELSTKKLTSKWDFTLPIRDVSDTGGDLFLFNTEQPTDLDLRNYSESQVSDPQGLRGLGFAIGGSKCDWQFNNQFRIPLKRDKALGIHPGQFLRISGKPFIAIRERTTFGRAASSKQAYIFGLDCVFPNGQSVYFDFGLRDPSFEILPAAEK